jgi:putative membrane protein insertion efficiency factor
MSPAARLLALPIRAYRLVLSPLLGPNCRFQPTCSAYALEALGRHGALRGGLLAVLRVARCHPWGGSGFDPVPKRPRDAP